MFRSILKFWLFFFFYTSDVAITYPTSSRCFYILFLCLLLALCLAWDFLLQSFCFGRVSCVTRERGEVLLPLDWVKVVLAAWREPSWSNFLPLEELKSENNRGLHCILEVRFLSRSKIWNLASPLPWIPGSMICLWLWMRWVFLKQMFLNGWFLWYAEGK